MADSKKRKSISEKLQELKDTPRMGVDELTLELISRVPDIKLTAKDGHEIILRLLDAIEDNVKAGRQVLLPGFGSFIPRERPARVVYNPKIKGKTVAKGPCMVFRFRAGVNMKPVYKKV